MSNIAFTQQSKSTRVKTDNSGKTQSSFFGFGYLVSRAPDYGMTPMGCGAWTTCPGLLPDSGMAGSKTHDLAIVKSRHANH